METYIPISKLNDYIFCPKSLYLHSIYENFSPSVYSGDKQISGKINHETIDNIKYSTRKNILQNFPVYSNKYGLMGKIDLFNTKTKELIERKTKIVKIYDGYKMQVYAQYLCLVEMGYDVKKITLYSLRDNKKYNIALPNKKDINKISQIISLMYNQDQDFKNIKFNKNKCENCIYRNLCNI